MRSQSKHIIRLLLENHPRTAANLAEELKVSVRSIKNYVHEINDEYPDTISSSRKGYAVDQESALKILSESSQHIPQNSKERIVYIINSLLNSTKKQILDVYDLCDELYISLSTLKNELNKVKKTLKKYDLELVMKGDRIECIGLEKNKRKLMSTILYDESNVNFVNIETLQHAFKDIDIQYIQQTVLEVFEKYHYYINDYSLINLVLHLTIAVDRIRNGNFNNQNIEGLPNIRLHEYSLAQEVAHKLEEKFNIVFTEAETYEMTLLIISRATTIDYRSINSSNLVDFVGEDCLELVKKLIDDINSFYYIDLGEQEFLIRFALHIKNLLVRSKNNYFSKNPLTGSIKVSCPLIYDASVSLARVIKEHTGISINDDEIAYIAFHLGSTLEAQKNLNDKITAVLYCPNYYDINLKVTDTINQYFSNDLLIRNILTDENEIDQLKDVDMIISTLPINKVTSLPIVQINIFMNQRDQNFLKEKIEQIRKEKQRREFETYLRMLIIPEFFEVKKGFKSYKECIDHMVKNMVSLGYVDNTFKKDVLEREKMSSTAFGSFAIPHAMKMYAQKTGINILISENPIPWNDKSVNLIIMMCFNKSERYMFNEIYEPITMILSEAENVKKVLAARTYEEFIDTMVSLL